MIDKQTRIEKSRWVEGDLGVHFVYTAGIAGEEFLRGLQKGKILASTCDSCETTYCPPRIFCESCLRDVTDRHEVPETGTLVSVARVHQDSSGAPREPEWVGAVRLDETDTTILHRLDGDAFAIGDRVAAAWATKRTGTILDLRAFKAATGAKAATKASAKGARTNGRAAARRVATVSRN